MIEEQAARRRLRVLRVTTTVIGAAMITLALAADSLGLGRQGSFGRGQILFLFTGILVLVVGLLTRVHDARSAQAFGRRIAALYRGAAILLLNTLVLLVCVELAAILMLRLADVFSGTPGSQLPDPRASLSYYTSQDWTTEYWKEFSSSRRRDYRPWVIYRRAAFEGKYININEEGVRRTPGADCSADSYRVFVLGASTVWGDGSPDWGTMPAYLQSGLEELLDGPVCVTNYGESGYVSTQDLIGLLTQLQHENEPDLVVFYGGIADVYAGYQSGQAGAHMNLDEIATRFMPAPGQSPFMQWLKASYSFSLVERAATKLKPQELVTYQTMGIDTEDLAESIVHIYLRNYEAVAALAREYGFEYLFFWQPTISIGEKQLTQEEQSIKSSMDRAFVDLYDATYRIVEETTPEYPNLYYMARIFDEEHSQIWIDRHYVEPPGNELIAHEMLDVISSHVTGE